ncbi:hypothetical protein AV530_006875 [Patagioenas fasciata monilis]|uniref:Dynactin subunit 2 n=1 Tax=Patagioenas fasciata monilis TaxID=372326 RepID=A0A1V4KQY7_PATFA|nr:hypothetical protein AV530_006875 [Patagioenas fasciata monilis]
MSPWGRAVSCTSCRWVLPLRVSPGGAVTPSWGGRGRFASPPVLLTSPGGPCPQEELSSTSVEHLIINPNAAYEKFKDKRLGAEGLDFSDGVSKARRTGCRSGERQVLGGGAQESPQQRYQRLQLEVQELLREVQRGPGAAEGPAGEQEPAAVAVALAPQAEALRQRLLSGRLQQLLGPSAAIDFADPEGALAKRLLQQLEAAKHSKAPPGQSPPAKSSSPPGDAVTFELYWRPEQDQFAQTAKVTGGWRGGCGDAA